ncbi:hypothetical protein IVB18_26245 [Bradyrhizobium sp. 186]|uniref:hypothetical protein n=1 Tax=Bradyrhizobium sp. 186 TaxID=2782654 RepID=UPI002001059A|nr:hypothetical protein [Bradyrhizobium sp. 186]UPK31833.1 hypothetical protein IVB18_26245 [Bradyrhizobium sp. 186]
MRTIKHPGLMMTASERVMGRFMRAPEHPPAATPPAGEVKPAGDVKPAPDPAASVLFPKEGEQPKPEPAAGDPPKEGDKPKAEDWKEYVADPAKSEADNATAKAAHDKTKPAAADPADTVPADGKYTLAMPEGVQVDQATLDALSPEFKEMGLTNKQAQKLADKFIEAQQKQAADKGKAWGETVTGWVDQAKADKEIGGDKWDGTVKTATRAVNTLGTPALKEYLEATGGGNHPELIRFMAKVGAMIKEDNPADGGAGGSGKPAEAAHVLFPHDAPKG